MFKNSATLKKGLANFIHISCNAFDFVYTTYSSKQVVREGLPGQNPFDINANEVHSGADDNLLCDIAVSCDGTWQKRGFSSLLGAATVISVDTGKCLGYKVMSKKCSLCTLWENRKGTDAYEKFISVTRDSHECSINHDGSAGSMEAKGVFLPQSRSTTSSRLNTLVMVTQKVTRRFVRLILMENR